MKEYGIHITKEDYLDENRGMDANTIVRTLFAFDEEYIEELIEDIKHSMNDFKKMADGIGKNGNIAITLYSVDGYATYCYIYEERGREFADDILKAMGDYLKELKGLVK